MFRIFIAIRSMLQLNVFVKKIFQIDSKIQSLYINETETYIF